MCGVSASNASLLARPQCFPWSRLPNHSSDVTGFQAAYRPVYLWTRPTLGVEHKKLVLDCL